MAFEKSFLALDGSECPAAYWRLMDIHINMESGYAEAVFLAYRSKEDRDAGRVSVRGGERHFRVDGSQFTELFASHLKPGGPNIYQLAYGFARQDDPYFADAKDV